MDTSRIRTGLRKAAILVASLDAAAADARAWTSWRPSRPSGSATWSWRWARSTRGEQRRVIDEFFRVGPMVPGQDAAGHRTRRRAWPGGWPPRHRRSLDEGSPRRRSAVAATAAPLPVPPRGRGRQAGPASWPASARRPSPWCSRTCRRSRRAACWRGCRRPQQVEVIRRLVDLEETDPEILREVEAGPASRGSRSRSTCSGAAWPGWRPWRASSRRPTAMRDADPRQPGRPRPVAGRAARPAAASQFDDLVDLDDETLPRSVRAAGQELLVPALVGAEPELIERVLRHAAGRGSRKRSASNWSIRARSGCATWKTARRRIAGMARRLMTRCRTAAVRRVSREEGKVTRDETGDRRQETEDERPVRKYCDRLQLRELPPSTNH